MSRASLLLEEINKDNKGDNGDKALLTKATNILDLILSDKENNNRSFEEMPNLYTELKIVRNLLKTTSK